MGERGDPTERRESLGGLIRGALLLVLLGTALGVAYNASGHASRPQFGIAWLASDPFEGLPALEAAVVDADGSPEPAAFSTTISDPMAIGVAPQRAANVPEVPDLDRPMQIQLDAAKQFFDADAAWFVDARDEEDCVKGRIAGASCLPYHEVTADPGRLAGLGRDGRPIITYCGGGLCEVSLGVAWKLIESGRSKVLVYMGGFSIWEEAGYPVECGAVGGAR